MLGFLWQIRSGSRGCVNGESVLLPNAYLDSEGILRMHTNCEWSLALSQGSVKGSHLRSVVIGLGLYGSLINFVETAVEVE